MTDTITALSFSRPSLKLAVRNLILSSALGDKIEMTEREPMFGGSESVLTLTLTDDQPPWSDGEILIWKLLASITGFGTVDLHAVASHLRGSHLANQVAYLLLTVMVDD